MSLNTTIFIVQHHLKSMTKPRAHLPRHRVHDLRQPEACGAQRSPNLLQQGGEDRGGGVSRGSHPEASRQQGEQTVQRIPPRHHQQRSDSIPQPELDHHHQQ